ncbi:unnamed protein product [Prunus armeniaca]|uniref:Uncharacterized protein n=1 Tax=Prunus armeniaca TaxID=36596 RepID=A0A6J5VCW0_PRUAR|nr:unnamed protein product [Prunus armeniaca]
MFPPIHHSTEAFQTTIVGSMHKKLAGLEEEIDDEPRHHIS